MLPESTVVVILCNDTFKWYHNSLCDCNQTVLHCAIYTLYAIQSMSSCWYACWEPEVQTAWAWNHPSRSFVRPDCWTLPWHGYLYRQCTLGYHTYLSCSIHIWPFVGHGPFSHLFQDLFIPHVKPTDRITVRKMMWQCLLILFVIMSPAYHTAWATFSQIVSPHAG